MKLQLVTSKDFLGHRAPTGHPENEGRLSEFWDKLSQNWVRPKLRKASEQEVLTQHSKEMFEALQSAAGNSGWFDADTFFGPRSVDVALLAAGSCIDLGLSVWKRDIDRGFALVRPPGHHAVKENPMGFCLLNNVAMAASAIKNEKPGVRLAIVDFDLHHGNGTQAAFWEDPDVLFLSSHRYPYYPGTGAMDEVGSGKGLGTTVNFPLDRVYDSIFFEALYGDIAARVLKEFQPEMILVSAGFDAHVKDPMAGLAVETESFAKVSRCLLHIAEEICGGRIVFFLEGGYNPTALHDSVAAVMAEMEKETLSQDLQSADAELLERFRGHFQGYFPSLS